MKFSNPVALVSRSPIARRIAIAAVIVLAGLVHSGGTGIAQAPSNPISLENAQSAGVTPQSTWDVAGVGNPDLQGFATDISVNVGTTVNFKIDASVDHSIDIYRLGYYNGNGARRIVQGLAHTTVDQNPCLIDAGNTELIDCGNWVTTASWAVPSSAVSGIYLARLSPTAPGDPANGSHIVFIVRDEASTSRMVFQTSDTTWQAYNTYGGKSLYTSGEAPGRAFKVSYNRPFATRDVQTAMDWLFDAEYPMVRFLEANGYDVSYISGVDTDRSGAAAAP